MQLNCQLLCGLRAESSLLYVSAMKVVEMSWALHQQHPYNNYNIGDSWPLHLSHSTIILHHHHTLIYTLAHIFI